MRTLQCVSVTPSVSVLSLVIFLCTAVRADAQWQYEVLHSFTSSEGASPIGPLIQGADGSFYGTTALGGVGDTCSDQRGCATVFRMDADGNVTMLHVLPASEGEAIYGGLVQARDGNFYGTAVRGGMYGRGTAFKMDLSGSLTVLHSFGNPADANDGWNPSGTLIEACDGYLYGTTTGGGVNSGGTVFRMDTDGNIQILLAFDPYPLHDGVFGIFFPEDGVIQAADGSLWGLAYFGGSATCGLYGCGGIFRVAPDGTVTTHQFTWAEGAFGSQLGLVQASDGKIYGAADSGGGANHCGTVYVIDTAGEFSVLTDFTQTEVCRPFGLIQAADGFLYGTAQNHVFQIGAFGAVTPWHMFGGSPDDGSAPLGGLVQANDGSLLGTTRDGGVENRGIVYRLTQP